MAPAAPGFRCELFFAVQPEQEDAERISAQAEAVRQALNLYGGSVVSAPRLHISLHGLGRYDAAPKELLARALDAAARVRLAPFEVAFDQLMSFGRPDAKTDAYPLVLTESVPDPGLLALHQRLGMALADAGIPVELPFHPHMTLSRHGKHVPSQPQAPMRWTARRFVLIWSHLGKTRYERAGDWLLTA
ncbi:2'-5' RNA ligase family protein [Ottowia flava]|uniref:2'-5' RNA ligase family protein n=1 Tax=Ottowia flava TaxID=2675430 RepID=A0ABW4KPY0_9BURK|nr:2'-5' RNA ligase family protein [Ottowia sp. GY511]